VRVRVSAGFAVAVKLNSADFQRGGFGEEDSRAVVAALSQEVVDLIEVSGGNYESPAMSGSAASSTRTREAYFLDYARSVREAAGRAPLAVTGGFRTRSGRQDALTAGDCDLVGIARPAVTTIDAADAILRGRAAKLETHEIAVGMRGLVGRLADLKTLDAVLNLSWNTDQLHRMARGLEPDLDRGPLRTSRGWSGKRGRLPFDCTTFGAGAASLTCQATKDPEAVEHLLGHASAAFTLDTYTSLFRESEREAAEAAARLVPTRRSAARAVPTLFPHDGPEGPNEGEESAKPQVSTGAPPGTRTPNPRIKRATWARPPRSAKVHLCRSEA